MEFLALSAWKVRFFDEFQSAFAASSTPAFLSEGSHPGAWDFDDSVSKSRHTLFDL